MRVGIDARSLTEPYPSGISWYTWEIIHALVQLSPTDQFCLFVSGWRVQSQWLDSLRSYPNVTVVHLPWPNKLFHTLALLHLAPRLDRLCGGVDVVFAPNINFLPVGPSVPVVLTIHDVSFRLYPQFLSWRRRLWHWAVQPKRLVQRAKIIITVSATTQHDVIQMFARSTETVYHIASGIPSATAAEPLPNLPERFVAAVSTIEPRKNIQALLAAWRIFTQRYPASQLHLVVIGAHGWKSRGTLKNLHRLARVHYYGYITPGQKTTLLQAARALLYPSIYEGFGFPALEAAAAGRPVVAGQAGALPKVLGSAAYYVNPYMITELITAVRVMDSDDVLRQQLITAGRQLCQRYNWQPAAQQTLKVLRQAI